MADPKPPTQDDDNKVPEALREIGDRGEQLTRPFDFIEKTRPEDRIDRDGQLTRDNVNPNIPSVTPEQVGSPLARNVNPGGIVDPTSLGMEQGGVAPPEVGPDVYASSEDDPVPATIVAPDDAEEPDPTGPPPEDVTEDEEVEEEELPSDAELMAMTRAELDAFAEERGIDSTSAATKADVIALLREDEEDE